MFQGFEPAVGGGLVSYGDTGATLGQIETLLKKAAQLDPSFADAHLELGNFYSQEHLYAEAVPESQRALQLDPNLPDAYYSLGQAYVRLGRKDLAEKEFAAHQKLYNRHLAEDDREREQIRQFVCLCKAENSIRNAPEADLEQLAAEPRLRTARWQCASSSIRP